MKSFENSYLTRMPISHGLVKTIRLIGEARGKGDLYKSQSPQTLKVLRESAVIQSTASSNRIEGVVIPDAKRLRDLVERKTQPVNRSEQEIAGYRDVLGLIHAAHQDIPLTPNIILQLHRDLFKYTATPGGNWKGSDNSITEVDPDGTERLRFQPVAAWQTPAAMASLQSLYEQSLQEPNPVEPLLSIPAYVLDFLCIHPFLDGNGRMARLLSLLLLYKAGYGVGQYIGLERIVEDTKDTYYDALYKSSQGWHEGQHDLRPWTEYFLGVLLLTAYREFEARVGQKESAKGAKGGMILDAIARLPPRFLISDVQALCPTVGVDYIRKVLRSEREAGRLQNDGRGPLAAWLKV